MNALVAFRQLRPPATRTWTLDFGWIRFACWKFLSKPAQDRLVYRLIDRGTVASITEIGIGDGLRAERMLAFALRHHAPDKIRYAGLDLFEARPQSSPGLSLKAAYRKFNAFGVQVRLVPGDVHSALVRSANNLPKTDLIIISGEVDPVGLEPAWFYFPRMMHENSTVLLETGNVKRDFQPLSYAQVAELAKKAASAVRRAA